MQPSSSVGADPPKAKTDGRWNSPWTVLLGALLILGAGALSLVPSPTDTSIMIDAVRGVVVLLVALVGLLTIGRALGIITRKEALGLPKGSIRALLALGLVVIFVVVASWSLSQNGQRGATPLFATQAYPATEAAAQAAKYQTQFPSPRFAVVLAAADGGASKVEVMDLGQTQQYADLQKQIVTIMATVLVTVIGFYFGGKSATDAAKAAVDIANSAAATSQSDLTAAAVSPPVTQAAVGALGSQLTSVCQATQGLVSGLGADPMALLKEACDGNPDSQVQQRLADASNALNSLTNAANAAATDSQRGAKALADMANAPNDPARLADAATQLQSLLGGATTAKGDADKAKADFLAARDDILRLTAKG